MLRIFVLLSLFFAALFADLKVVNENELTQMQNKNVVVIDIRTLGEWKEYGIIENAKPITFFDEKGIGEIKNSKVFYKATYWDIDSKIDEKEFVEGEKVVVLKTHKNQATIEKR